MEWQWQGHGLLDHEGYRAVYGDRHLDGKGYWAVYGDGPIDQNYLFRVNLSDGGSGLVCERVQCGCGDVVQCLCRERPAVQCALEQGRW